MSGLSRSDHPLRALIRDPEFRVSLGIIWFAPLVYLALAGILIERQPYFAPGFFLAGTSLELAIDAFLRWGGTPGRFTRHGFHRWQYLNRTILGLPFTIYLAMGAAYPAVALFRLLPALYLFGQNRQFTQSCAHLGLFAAGLFIYGGILHYRWPGDRGILIAAIGCGLGALVMVRERLTARLTLVAAGTRRELLRGAARLQAATRREKRLLRTILPDAAVRLYQQNRNIEPEAGEFVCVAVAFPDLNEAAAAWVRPAAAEMSQADTLREWEHEWELCVDRYRSGLSEAGCGLVLNTGMTIYGACRLASGELTSADEQAIFRLVFATRTLLEFSERSRRLLEHRGRSGWRALAVLATGSAVLTGTGPSNAGRVLRGPLAATLEQGLLAMARMRPEPGRVDRLWLAAMPAAIVRPCFAPSELRFSEDEKWLSPGLLRADYSTGGDGVQPVPDLLERVRYGGDQGRGAD
jgi:hypothetical protein